MTPYQDGYRAGKADGLAGRPRQNGGWLAEFHRGYADGYAAGERSRSLQVSGGAPARSWRSNLKNGAALGLRVLAYVLAGVGTVTATRWIIRRSGV